MENPSLSMLASFVRRGPVNKHCRTKLHWCLAKRAPMACEGGILISKGNSYQHSLRSRYLKMFKLQKAAG